MIIELVHVRMLNLRLGRDGLQVGNIAMGKARVKLTNSQDRTSNTVRQRRDKTGMRLMLAGKHLELPPGEGK